MAMISMKMDREEAKETAPGVISDAPEYPYGLELHLDDRALEKLSLTQPPAVGTQLMIQARVTVTSASSFQTMGGEAEGSSNWQITDMEVAPAPTQSDAGALYKS